MNTDPQTKSEMDELSEKLCRAINLYAKVGRGFASESDEAQLERLMDDFSGMTGDKLLRFMAAPAIRKKLGGYMLR